MKLFQLRERCPAMPGMRRRRKIEKNVKVKYCPIVFGWLVCFFVGLMHNRNKRSKQRCCQTVFRAVVLSSQCFCLVFGRGDGQKVIPRSGVGRPWREIQKEVTIISRRKRGKINYLDGSGHKGPADFL